MSEKSPLLVSDLPIPQCWHDAIRALPGGIVGDGISISPVFTICNSPLAYRLISVPRDGSGTGFTSGIYIETNVTNLSWIADNSDIHSKLSTLFFGPERPAFVSEDSLEDAPREVSLETHNGLTISMWGTTPDHRIMLNVTAGLV